MVTKDEHLSIELDSLVTAAKGVLTALRSAPDDEEDGPEGKAVFLAAMKTLESAHERLSAQLVESASLDTLAAVEALMFEVRAAAQKALGAPAND